MLSATPVVYPRKNTPNIASQAVRDVSNHPDGAGIPNAPGMVQTIQPTEADTTAPNIITKIIGIIFSSLLICETTRKYTFVHYSVKTAQLHFYCTMLINNAGLWLSNTCMKNPTPPTERPPIVVVMGHVDHGKSTLLDFIRKSNVVAGEHGGITQHVAAYEVEHCSPSDPTICKRVTFIDTPGHAAFSAIRARGANVANIAILVVAADDGVKAQTLEALESIRSAKIPFIVAINKIDKPNADVNRTHSSLMEKGVYLEKLGGDVPWVAISAKTGMGVDFRGERTDRRDLMRARRASQSPNT